MTPFSLRDSNQWTACARSVRVSPHVCCQVYKVQVSVSNIVADATGSRVHTTSIHKYPPSVSCHVPRCSIPSQHISPMMRPNELPENPISTTESHVDFIGESEGSLPQPQDSFLDAGEAINDFWSMSGNFIYRHHVEPRVKLYSPREESFPIPLKYIDVSRTTHTNLDVKQEKRIDDYWNIDGSRDLSDPWTGFTKIFLLEEKPPDGWPGGWGPQGRS